MDAGLGEAMQGMIRLIDNVNDRSMLNGLSLDLSMIVAVAMRRQGLLSAMEIDMIDQVFDNTEADWPEEQSPKAKELLDVSRKLWNAAEAR
jgi:hypothetical protein